MAAEHGQARAHHAQPDTFLSGEAASDTGWARLDGEQLNEHCEESTRAIMTATLLNTAAASLQSPSGGWDLGPWKQSKVCQLAQVQCGGRAAYIQAVTSGDATTWVLCNPSVYGGTGQEDRKGILFGTSPRSH